MGGRRLRRCRPVVAPPRRRVRVGGGGGLAPFELVVVVEARQHIVAQVIVQAGIVGIEVDRLAVRPRARFCGRSLAGDAEQGKGAETKQVARMEAAPGRRSVGNLDR